MDFDVHPESLRNIFRQFPFPVLSPVPDLLVTGVVADSRQVLPGSLFVACPGENTDGHRYIPAAIQRGAAAVAGSQPIQDLPVPFIRLEDSRQALAHLAAGFYDYPARKLTVIGVTGTDGKTTTTNLIYEILKAAGRKAGMISTVNAVIGQQVLDTVSTSPPPMRRMCSATWLRW